MQNWVRTCQHINGTPCISQNLHYHDCCFELVSFFSWNTNRGDFLQFCFRKKVQNMLLWWWIQKIKRKNCYWCKFGLLWRLQSVSDHHRKKYWRKKNNSNKELPLWDWWFLQIEEVPKRHAYLLAQTKRPAQKQKAKRRWQFK